MSFAVLYQKRHLQATQRTTDGSGLARVQPAAFQIHVEKLTLGELSWAGLNPGLCWLPTPSAGMRIS